MITQHDHTVMPQQVLSTTLIGSGHLFYLFIHLFIYLYWNRYKVTAVKIQSWCNVSLRLELLIELLFIYF